MMCQNFYQKIYDVIFEKLKETTEVLSFTTVKRSIDKLYYNVNVIIDKTEMAENSTISSLI